MSHSAALSCVYPTARGVAGSTERVTDEELVALARRGDTDAYDPRACELRAHAARAIEALPPKLRDALLLAASGEYDYGAIAAMLKSPAGTLKWRVAEARKQVRAHLSALGYIDVRCDLGSDDPISDRRVIVEVTATILR